jgi:hypothetical protein
MSLLINNITGIEYFYLKKSTFNSLGCGKGVWGNLLVINAIKV